MRRTKKLQPSTTIGIVVDGETEYWYFQMLKRNERHLRLNIKPEIPHKKCIEDQYKLVLKLAQDYTFVFWIVDLDVILKESEKTKKGKETPIQKFNKLREKISACKNIEVLVNNPCLEMWFLLHFAPTTRQYIDCLTLLSTLKKHLPDYEKSQTYYTKQDHDLYLKLRPKLSHAISNAKLVGGYTFDTPENSISEMNTFFESTQLIKSGFKINNQN